MKKILLIVCSLILLQMPLTGQEIISKVRITTPKLQITDPKVFENLETAMEEFINSQKWTNDVYEPHERISCNIQLNIKEEISDTRFKGEIAIQATRPVYGSNYKTPLIAHVDRDVLFSYESYQPLEFSKNTFNDNLTSILAFYVYIILGQDYDSFSPRGGQPYFLIAQDIINTVPQNIAGTVKGWQSLESQRNRYWIVENILNPRVRPMRAAWYKYHREGLDIMYQNAAAGREVIMEALKTIENVNKEYPNAMIIQMFANAKSEEVIEIFKQGDYNSRNKVYQIMAKLDPANASDYRAVLGR